MTVTIRPAKPGDLEQIYSTDSLCQYSARREIIERAVDSGSCLVAVSKTILGYAILEYSFFEHGFVSLLVVHSEHQRQGVGSALLKHLESICSTEKLFTSTNESNLPMQALLEKLDYQSSGIIYGLDKADPELIFRKELHK